MNRMLAFFTLLITSLCMLNVAFADDAIQEGLNIGAQPLASALREFSEQTGLQIGYAAELADGKETKGVEGVDDPEVALDALLASTGLEHRYINDQTVVIQATVSNEDAAESGVGKSEPMPSPILMAQASASQSTRTSVRNPSEAGVATVSGRVLEGSSGGSLAGALVKIVESGRTTITDSGGNFRFSSVLPGSYTLSISYLGFPQLDGEFTLKSGEDLQLNYSLGQLEEIVVFGTRSSRAIALNQERTSDNSVSVISADTLGHFSGTTLAESLRRVPGVAFERDVNTGEGKNIMIRGLAPEMNAVRMNGIEMPSPGTRTPNLNILADSIDTINIHKTLLPSHSSAGTGGLVEIETKSPLNRPHRFASFVAESGGTRKNFIDDQLLSGTVSGIFGRHDNIGFSASAQYRELDVSNVLYNSQMDFGQYLPLRPDGTPLQSRSLVSPLTVFPFEPGVDAAYPNSVNTFLNTSKNDDFASTISGEWRITPESTLRFDWQTTLNKGEEFSRSSEFTARPRYELLPVQALGGEERYALTAPDEASTSSVYSFSPDIQDRNDMFSIRGETTANKWTMDYTLGYALGRRQKYDESFLAASARNVVIDPTFVSAAAVDNTEGRMLSLFDERSGSGLPVPLLSAEGWAYFNDPANIFFESGRVNGSFDQKNRRSSGEINFKYDIDRPHLDYIKFGVRFGASNFKRAREIGALNVGKASFFTDISLADLGLALSRGSFERVGADSGLQVVSQDDMATFLRNFRSLAGGNPDLRTIEPSFHPELGNEFTDEGSFSAYLESRFNLGRLEIIGGARYNQVRLEAGQLTFPGIETVDEETDFQAQEELTTIVVGKATVHEFLPRVGFNFRQNDNLIYRLGYYRSLARPSLNNLSKTQDIFLSLAPFYGPTGDRPLLFVSQGNPKLEPANTDNFDLSLEYYHDQIGVVKLSGFYKRTKKLVEDAEIERIETVDDITLPDHPVFDNLPDNIFITGTKVFNSSFPAEVWGFEAQIERQFGFLPGIWGGFGIYANYTLADSSKTEFVTFRQSPVLDANGNIVSFESVTFNIDVPYDNSPERTGNLALTYNASGIDATLSHTFQSNRARRFEPHGLHFGTEGWKTLDLRIEYGFDYRDGKYRVYFEGDDLLRNASDAGVENTLAGNYFSGGSFLGGRTLKLGLGATF